MPQVNDRPRGFLTFAQNNGNVDYVRLSYGLALSLKHSQKSVPYLSIAITPGTIVDDRYAWAFDNIIEIPWGDHAADKEWKLDNEWKAPWISPYYETIKLDADMLFPHDISKWWDEFNLQPHSMVYTNQVLDWKGSNATSDYYRKTFTANKLPNIYTAFTYFRKNDEIFEFYNLVKLIYWNWETFFDQFLEPINRPTYPSTDVIFALAAKFMDLDQTAYKSRSIPTFTHMKSRLQGWDDENASEDWTEYLQMFLNPTGSLKIGNHTQLYPLHYHVKSALTDDIIKTYERLVGHG